MSSLCKCDLRTRLVGDGCDVCNPELAARHKEQAHPCDNGCQYSKDVGMWPEHSCGSKCMYDTEG